SKGLKTRSDRAAIFPMRDQTLPICTFMSWRAGAFGWTARRKIIRACGRWPEKWLTCHSYAGRCNAKASFSKPQLSAQADGQTQPARDKGGPAMVTGLYDAVGKATEAWTAIRVPFSKMRNSLASEWL